MSTTYRFFATWLCFTVLVGISGVAAAQDVPAQPQPAPNNVETTQYNDWIVRCPASGDQPCEMTQLVVNPENNKPIMRVVVGYPRQTQGQPAMVLILPLGVRLDSGVQLSVGGGPAHRFPFQVCLQQGCQAAFPIESTLMSQLKNGTAARVSVIGPKGQPIDVEFSLMGFTAASERIAP